MGYDNTCYTFLVKTYVFIKYQLLIKYVEYYYTKKEDSSVFFFAIK